MKSLADMANLATKTNVNKLTNLPNSEVKQVPKHSPDELVMVGVRMTKKQRRDAKKLAGDLELSLQDLVQEGFRLVRESRGLR